MAFREIFSTRLARQKKAGKPDVYVYDSIPQHFKVQVVHIWRRAIGDFMPHGSRGFLFDAIETDLAEAHGFFPPGYPDASFSRVATYFLGEKVVPWDLDIIEVSFHAIDTTIREAIDKGYATPGVTQHPSNAIQDLNRYFRLHSLGYHFTGGQVFQVDSEFVHAEIVKPALALLHTKGFAGPEEEFLKAHKHYREGNYSEAIAAAAKAFESTMKAICKARRWPYDPDKDTAKKLIEILLAKGLIPEFLSSPFTGLRSVLESAVPTTRNRRGGHGQGPEPVEVPEHLAAYVLHSTASNIVMLVEAHRST